MSPLSAANRLRLAAALGLALAALSASSVVAWKFGHARELGQPLWGAFYHPLAVVAWLRTWGGLDGYRQPFLQALSLVLVLAVTPVAVARLAELYGPLRVEQRPRDDGLGTARDLLRSGHIRGRGAGVVLGRLGRDRANALVKSTTLRKVLEVLAIIACVFFVFMQNDLKTLIIEDPLPNLVIPVWVLVAYLFSAKRI